MDGRNTVLVFSWDGQIPRAIIASGSVSDWHCFSFRLGIRLQHQTPIDSTSNLLRRKLFLLTFFGCQFRESLESLEHAHWDMPNLASSNHPMKGCLIVSAKTIMFSKFKSSQRAVSCSKYQWSNSHLNNTQNPNYLGNLVILAQLSKKQN